MEKIKLFLESEKGKDVLIIVIVILVGLASFELGRLSKEDLNNGLKIEDKSQEANLIGSFDSNIDSENQISTSNSGNYFASKKGKKYYSTTCGAGKTIKQENRIYFSSADEAISAGYELSNGCR